jgi:transcriptional regulator with XRE-family HTH domain
MVAATVIDLEAMDFAHRLVAIRKQRGIGQAAFAEQIGVHVSQVRRYENGTSQPTLDVLRRIAVALSITIDELAFGADDRASISKPPAASTPTNKPSSAPSSKASC